jgi:hypothetical protein
MSDCVQTASSLSRQRMLRVQEQPALLVLIGLIGIIATGAILGIGGDNYWAVGNIGSLDPSVVSSNGRLLMAALAVLIELFDVVAFGVIFAGGVILVQRLRGRV